MAGTIPHHYVLVVGSGSIGERHIRCFQATGRCEVSFVEIDETLRNSISAKYGVRGFSDLAAAISHGSTTAVVATPAHLHIEMALRLANANIHTLIEKPLSTRAEGISRLQQIVYEQRLAFGVAYVYRSHPVLADMRQAILAGKFGRPVEIVAVSGQHFPTYRPAYRQIYYRDRATGGGAIQDALTHLLNAGEWLVGPITKLVVDAAHQVLEGVAVEDTVHLLARHGDVLGSYSLNQYQAPNETTLTVVCERGTARFEVHASRWRWMTTPGSEWQEGKAQPLERDELFTRQAQLFLDAAEGKRDPTCTLHEGLQTLRLNLAALRSLETGKWQTISTEAES